jgi:outer membrane protein assembly factor BamB/tRNA A-37 threonylcarbamoyl transferase component Bud32
LDTQRITPDFNSGPLPDKQLQSGSILVNRYAIQEVIGVGGMGSVYRARDLHFPNAVKLVAVKEMINQARDPLVRQTIVQNFEREANILVALEHPSIPRIFDYFTHNERSYLVLEYIQGKDMEELLAQTDTFFPEELVIQWAIELCDVLNFLHNHKPEPIIFRDMKPSNIMVNPNNHIVLIDFGIAKNFRTTQKGTMIGTEGYSPPEQYRGEASPQADIYALGATLHHVLTRKDPRLEPPFTFGDRPVRKSNPAISAEMEAVVATALQYNPSDRFQTALDMKEAMINVGRKTGLLSRIVSSPITMPNDGPRALWTFPCEDEIRGTPLVTAGAVYMGAYDNNLYVVDPADGSFIWKFPTDGGIVSKPVLADDYVLFGSEDHKLYAVSSRTGKLAWTYQTDGPVRSSPVVAEGHVFFGSDDGFCYAVSLTSNRLFWRFDAGGAVRSTPLIFNDQICFGTDMGDFYSLTLNGQVKWRSKAKRAIFGSPVISKNIIYYTSLDGFLYAVDAKSGWSVWRFRMGKGSAGTPCIVDNYIIVGSADASIYCVEASSAREVWRFKAEHQVSGSPVVHKDSVYCGTADGSLYCLEYRTGRVRWKFMTSGAITGSPIVYNDTLYVGSADHILYALNT